MTGTTFQFQFRGKFYSGMFQKFEAAGTEREKFKIFDIDPKDYSVPEPFYISKNYDDDNFSFPVQEDQNEAYLQTIVNAVITEAQKG